MVIIPLIRPLHTNPNLHRNRDNIRTLWSNMFCLPQSLSLVKFLPSRSSKRILLTVLGDFLLECRIMPTHLPGSFKLIRSTWDFAFHSFPSFSLLRISNRSQEVTSCLTRWAFPAHINKVFFGLATRAEEGLSPFIQHDYLIEDIVDRLRGLVNRYGVSRPRKVCRHAQCFSKLQSTCGIQASSAVIPCSNRGTRY